MSATAPRPRRLLLCLLIITTLASAAFAATASAAANPQPFYHQETDVGQNTDPQPCNGLPGTTFTNTITERGHKVFSSDGTLEHFFFIQTQDIREDWIDGTYLIAQIVGPASFNVNPTGNQTFSGVARRLGTLYSATGQILGPLDTVGEFHYTYVDGNFVSNTFQLRITSSPC
jgi:hypothetical protein